MFSQQSSYTIVQTHAYELMADVQRAVKRGWTPYPFIYSDENFLYQPMSYSKKEILYEIHPVSLTNLINNLNLEGLVAFRGKFYKIHLKIL